MSDFQLYIFIGCIVCMLIWTGWCRFQQYESEEKQLKESFKNTFDAINSMRIPSDVKDDEDTAAFERIDMLVKEYGCAKDSELTDSAKDLKNKIICKVTEWNETLKIHGI